MALQKAQATTILHQAGSCDRRREREASFKLGVLPSFEVGFSLISLHNLLPATGDGFRSEVLCFLLLRLTVVVGSVLLGAVFC